jgi:2',3'-cyclic-nucleotide 2'-phosphodiesterase (5'-nucleotidase family)
MLKLTILHTNDMHGRVQQLERIATLVRRIRGEVETGRGSCLYVDTGDAEDTSLLESSLTKGSAMNAILRGAGCDYVALGNAIPPRYGIQPIKEMAASFGRPLLCANLFDENSELIQGLEPFTIIDLQDHKVGMIGLTAPLDSYQTFFHLKTKEAVEILPELITELQNRGAGTIILLSHLGSKADQEVAEKIPGIHVIIGAHDHQMISPPLVVNDTIIVQAGDFGKFLGRLDLTIDTETGKVSDHNGILLPIDESIPPDPDTQKVVASERIRIDQLMRREIGTLVSPIELADDQECSAGNLLADALLERVKDAQISFVLAGHWETGLKGGPLTQGELFTASRSTANPAWIKLTGSQIKQFLREASKPENAERKPHSLRGRAVGMPHFAGVRILCKTNEPENVEIELQGKPIEDNEAYLVASTDMEFADFIGYLVIPVEDIEFEVPTIIPEVLEDYIKKHSPLSPPNPRISQL